MNIRTPQSQTETLIELRNLDNALVGWTQSDQSTKPNKLGETSLETNSIRVFPDSSSGGGRWKEDLNLRSPAFPPTISNPPLYWQP